LTRKIQFLIQEKMAFFTPKLEVFKKFRENDGFTFLNDFLTTLDQKQIKQKTLLAVNLSGNTFHNQNN
jgi:hypothetical protein